MAKRKRSEIDNFQNTLKFQHEDFPLDKFEIMHPNVVTANADVVILPQNSSDNKKPVVIPVNRTLIEIVPYFKAKFSEVWKEAKKTKNNEILKVKTPEGIKTQAIFEYIKSLYDQEKDPLTKKNCVDIFSLASFWCDDFMKEQAVQFIVKNVDQDIFADILKNGNIDNCFNDLIVDVSKHAFSRMSFKDKQRMEKLILDNERYSLVEYYHYSATYSSKSDPADKHRECRLFDKEFGWVPESSNMKFSAKAVKANWIIMDLREECYINSIGIQGGSKPGQGHCQRFKLKYWSFDEFDEDTNKFVEGGAELLNPSNKYGGQHRYGRCGLANKHIREQNLEKCNIIKFSEPIHCRYIKFLPTFWEDNLFVNFGVYQFNGKTFFEDSQEDEDDDEY